MQITISDHAIEEVADIIIDGVEIKSFKFNNIDCDNATKDLLTSIVIQHAITQEQVEVLWALTKDVEVVEFAAKQLDRGARFPDDDLGDLCVFVKKCIKKNMWDDGGNDILSDIRAGMVAIANAGLKAGDLIVSMGEVFKIARVSIKDAIISIEKFNEAMQDIEDHTKNNKSHRPARMRKKHVLEAANHTRMRTVLPQPHRRCHIHQRRG
uniref:Uncharacterized protein n=1 Tax=viral metagenome TaxID=1070528 RepID=A0A6M3J270_9ZZZZ